MSNLQPNSDFVDLTLDDSCNPKQGFSEASQNKSNPKVTKIKFNSHSDILKIVEATAKKLEMKQSTTQQHPAAKNVVQQPAADNKCDQLKSLKVPSVAQQPHQLASPAPQPEYSLNVSPPSPQPQPLPGSKPGTTQIPGSSKKNKKNKKKQQAYQNQMFQTPKITNIFSISGGGVAALIPYTEYKNQNPNNNQGKTPNNKQGKNPSNNQGKNNNQRQNPNNNQGRNPANIQEIHPNNKPGINTGYNPDQPKMNPWYNNINQPIMNPWEDSPGNPAGQPHNPMNNTGGALTTPAMRSKTQIISKMNQAARQAGRHPTPQNRMDMLGLLGHANDPEAVQAVQYRAGIPKSFLATAGMAPDTVHHAASQPARPPARPPTFAPTFTPAHPEPPPVTVDTDTLPTPSETYSPTDQYTASELYAEEMSLQECGEYTESTDAAAGGKRLSAFQRLGPAAQPQQPPHKKHKMTINLLFSREHGQQREVVEAAKSPEKEKVRPATPEPTPVHLRQDVIDSADHTVIRFLPFWPWRGDRVRATKTAAPRKSKSVMLFELEQMVGGYDSPNAFIQLSITGYPKTFSKEDVLDLLLTSLKDKYFIPCFIEFTPRECKFLSLRCRGPLQALHRMGLTLDCRGTPLTVSISLTNLTLRELDYIPKLILKKRLVLAYDGERTLDLEAFTLQPDVSHFVYFPLSQVPNQIELINLMTVNWSQLVELNLARNRITSLEGFELARNAPKLRVLDLSHNHIPNMKVLLQCRSLPLRSLTLEGNPLCGQHVSPDRYVQLARMLFPELTHLDGIALHRSQQLPPARRNYCPAGAALPAGGARALVERLLGTYYPLLERAADERARLQDAYHERAVWTLTYRARMRCMAIFRRFRELFARSRSIEEDNLACVEGAPNIAKHLCRWPLLRHDPFSFTVDVLHHTETDTVCRVGGILNVTSESLADEEHMVHFTRTLVLHTDDGREYKIRHEMLHWDLVTDECARTAFNMTQVKSKKLSLKIPIGYDVDDENLKEELLDIFIQITNAEKSQAYRCLQLDKWDLKSALEYYMRIVKIECGTIQQ